MTIRVVLGEDRFPAREAIAGVLQRTEGIELVGNSSDVDGLRAVIDETRPDVVVTDIRMPHQSVLWRLRGRDTRPAMPAATRRLRSTRACRG